MMDDLGQNYLDTGHYPEAIALYKDLLVRDRSGDKTCVYQAHITEATMAMKSGNKEGIKLRARQPGSKIYNEYKAGNHPPTRSRSAPTRRRRSSSKRRWRGTWKRSAPGGQRGTGDPRTMGLAAYFYKKVVRDSGTRRSSRTFQFPRIVKEDWPTIYKIKYDMADLLYFQQRWKDCAARRSTTSSPRTPGARRPRRPRTLRCSATRTSTTRRTPTAPTRRAPATSRAQKGGKERPRPTTIASRSSSSPTRRRG